MQHFFIISHNKGICFGPLLLRLWFKMSFLNEWDNSLFSLRVDINWNIESHFTCAASWILWASPQLTFLIMGSGPLSRGKKVGSRKLALGLLFDSVGYPPQAKILKRLWNYRVSLFLCSYHIYFASSISVPEVEKPQHGKGPWLTPHFFVLCLVPDPINHKNLHATNTLHVWISHR